MVAGFAEALAVTGAGGSAVVPGGDVVVVADRGVAVRGAAGIVPDVKEALQARGEEPGFGVHRQQFPAAGGGVEPPDPQAGFVVAGAVEGDVPALGCR
ncbi:hypothetical protein QFZ35_001391 [Arthrobacter ulcerisalmonis]|nr:hypothetical protein [Arthrobacter ulcerisalmonis]